MKHGQRGQSIFETALFVPLFLLSLYGIFVVVTEGSMSERVQLGVRNGGSIFAPGNPYLSYSSYNLYSSIDGVDPSDPSGSAALFQARAVGIGARRIVRFGQGHRAGQRRLLSASE
jgi:hypothetical protein